MIKKILIAALVAIIAVIIIVRSIPREEDRVKRDINAFKTAVENKERQAVIDFFDPGFTDNHTQTYEIVAHEVQNLFDQFDSISIAMTGLQVTIDSSAAGIIFASCSLGLKVFARYGTDRVILYGGVIRPAAVRAFLRKTGSRYTVYKAIY
jgi:hypothetical protein